MVTICWCPVSTGRGREFHHPGRGASSDGGWGVRPCWSPVTTDRGAIIWRTGDQRYLRPLSDTEILTPVTTISQLSDDHKNCTVECGLGLERNPSFIFIGWTLVWVWSITRIQNPSLCFSLKFSESLWPDCVSGDSDSSDHHHAGTAAGRGHPRPPHRRLGPLHHRQGAVWKVNVLYHALV